MQGAERMRGLHSCPVHLWNLEIIGSTNRCFQVEVRSGDKLSSDARRKNAGKNTADAEAQPRQFAQLLRLNLPLEGAGTAGERLGDGFEVQFCRGRLQEFEWESSDGAEPIQKALDMLRRDVSADLRGVGAGVQHPSAIRLGEASGRTAGQFAASPDPTRCDLSHGRDLIGIETWSKEGYGHPNCHDGQRIEIRWVRCEEKDDTADLESKASHFLDQVFANLPFVCR